MTKKRFFFQSNELQRMRETHTLGDTRHCINYALQWKCGYHAAEERSEERIATDVDDGRLPNESCAHREHSTSSNSSSWVSVAASRVRLRRAGASMRERASERTYARMRVQRAIKRGAGDAMLNEMYARVHTHARSDTGTARCARAVSARPRNIRIGRARVRARAHV